MQYTECQESRRSTGKAFYLIINLIFIVFCLACIVPFLLLISISFSDEVSIYTHGYTFIPVKFSLEAYKFIFQQPQALINGYVVTICVAIVGTICSLVLTTSFAYVISRKDYKYIKFTSYYLYITMMFSGGIVPWYILTAKTLHMSDTFFALFIPALLSGWNVYLLQGFMKSISFNIIESAKIDGASEFMIYFRIILPLSKGGIATIALFTVLGFWNDWWLPLIFINNSKFIPLQYMLYKMLSNMEYITNNEFISKNISKLGIKAPTLTMRMAMCILAAGPMLVVFPFFQKYFVKGITIGSIKG